MSSKGIESENTQQIKMLLWSTFAGSKGCINRVKIVTQLRETQALNLQNPMDQQLMI